jgi:hypothetical protein
LHAFDDFEEAAKKVIELANQAEIDAVKGN